MRWTRSPVASWEQSPLSETGDRMKEKDTRRDAQIQRVARLTVPTAEGQRLIDVFESVGTSESLSAWFYKGACPCWSRPCYVFFRVRDREAQTKTTWTMTLVSTPCFWQRASIKHVAQTQFFDRTPWWLRDAWHPVSPGSKQSLRIIHVVK